MSPRPRPLSETEFWSLIALLEGEPHGAGLLQLTAELRRRGKRTARGFAERLARVLYELDREALADRTVRWADSPDADPIPLSDDGFLYLRAAVVAAGPDAVAAALADPGWLETRLWSDGEELLYAAAEAIGDDVEVSVSYETGSNVAHWSAREESADTGPMLVGLALDDLREPIEGWLDEAMTVPLAMWAWPTWLPEDVLDWTTGQRAGGLVGQGGWTPAALGGERIELRLGFGERWALTPVVTVVEDEFAPGSLLVRLAVELPQSTVRGWTRDEQATALWAVVARTLLAVLPVEHPALPELRAAATSELLPAG